MSWPPATRQDHVRFCDAEGWDRIRDARGRTGTHHLTYEFHCPDGRVLRTRIPHAADHTAYGPSLWSHILRDQLDVTEGEFRACVHDGVIPDRGAPVLPVGALPADLVHLLITRVGLAESEVAAMTKDEAVQRLNRHWAGED